MSRNIWDQTPDPEEEVPAVVDIEWPAEEELGFPPPVAPPPIPGSGPLPTGPGRILTEEEIANVRAKIAELEAEDQLTTTAGAMLKALRESLSAAGLEG